VSPAAETVRSVLRWALPLVLDDGPAPRSPSTGYSQVSFGRMLSRSDPLTAADIISSYCPDLESREGVEMYLGWIRRDRQPVLRRRQPHPGLPLARELLERMRAYHPPPERRLLEQGSQMTWKQLETHWPGRVWFSLRDDYERLAEKFWRSEQFFICETSEFVVKLGKVRELASASER
jgi:hypothetical protein